MEGIVQYGHSAGQSREAQLANLMRKVKIELVRQELISVNLLIQTYLTIEDPKTLPEKATYFTAYNIYEGKVRKKLMNQKPEYTLSIDIVEAYALELVLLKVSEKVNFTDWDNMVIYKVIAAINQQTL